MNILFLSISQIISDIDNRGIYPDLLRKFAAEGHEVYIVCPFERRLNKKTAYTQNNNIHTLGVQTLNITKSNVIEKGIGTILIEHQYKIAINKYLKNTRFDLILYSTPPITFHNIVKYYKNKYRCITYLMLKDIFPQNAIDLGLMKKKSPIYKYFRKKEEELYKISDYIGCMSPANVNYLIDNNAYLNKSKIEVCPNSIEVSEIIKRAEKLSLYLKYNIPINSILLIYGGNIGIGQGIDFIISVLDSNKNRDDIFFLIIGKGNAYKKLENWMSSAKPLNAALHPFIPQNDFNDLLTISDIGLIFLDSRFTIPNIPSRLLSYLDNELPVLMATDDNTDLGSIAEENKFGFWVKSDDTDKFNIKMETLIKDKTLRKSMGLIGKSFLKNNYSVDNSYNTIIAHFK
jgi:glycosyltransferase involved in cell wall biosynthesis